MFFRNMSPMNRSGIIYLPKHNHVPVQSSPQCYYFTFLHLLAMHGKRDCVPSYVREIVDACQFQADGYREIMIDKITRYAEELVWIADEIMNDEDDDYDGDWIVDFMDKYGVDFAMARLLNLPVKEFAELNMEVNTLTPEQLGAILERFGPIAIRISRGNDLSNMGDLSVAETVRSSSGLVKSIYAVDDYPAEIPHCVLLVGCSKQPAQQVYFVDPNYPQIILSMRFELFRENILIPEFVCFARSTLKPDDVIFSSIQQAKRKNVDNGQQMKRSRYESNPAPGEAGDYLYSSLVDGDGAAMFWRAENEASAPAASERQDYSSMSSKYLI